MRKCAGIPVEDIITSEKSAQGFLKVGAETYISFLWLQGMLVAPPNRQVSWGQMVLRWPFRISWQAHWMAHFWKLIIMMMMIKQGRHWQQHEKLPEELDSRSLYTWQSWQVQFPKLWYW